MGTSILITLRAPEPSTGRLTYIDFYSQWRHGQAAMVVIALAPHLAGCEHDQVDLEVSLKDTEGPGPEAPPCKPGQRDGRTSWQTSHERDLERALAEVHIDLIRQIEEERSGRESRKRRTTRYPTT
jgi:hypothetical protein